MYSYIILSRYVLIKSPTLSTLFIWTADTPHPKSNNGPAPSGHDANAERHRHQKPRLSIMWTVCACHPSGDNAPMQYLSEETSREPCNLIPFCYLQWKWDYSPLYVIYKPCIKCWYFVMNISFVFFVSIFLDAFWSRPNGIPPPWKSIVVLPVATLFTPSAKKRMLRCKLGLSSNRLCPSKKNSRGNTQVDDWMGDPYRFQALYWMIETGWQSVDLHWKHHAVGIGLMTTCSHWFIVSGMFLWHVFWHQQKHLMK